MNLKQLANCYLHLGDIMNIDQEDEYGYKAAYDIHLKLFENDEKSVKDKLILTNRKLSDYHEKLGENEEALKFLKQTVDLEQPTIFTLYRLAFLNIACDRLDEAIENYETILSEPSLQGKKVIETIVREKLDEVKKKQEEQQRRRQFSASSESDNDSSNSVSHQRTKNTNDISNALHDKDEVELNITIQNTGKSGYSRFLFLHLKYSFTVH